QLGIPFRIGIEAAFLGSIFLVLTALFDRPTQSYLALGLYLFAIFNPAVEELLSHLMSDQVWLVETLAGFSLFVLFAGTASRLRWGCVLLGALCLGFSVVTRSTFVPLLITFLVWAMLSVGLAFLRNQKCADLLPIAGGCFLCLYAVAVFYYGTCFHNSKNNGFFGLSAFDSREYQDFYMRLQSVGEPTGDAYFPIDDNRLSLIATAGPRSRWFVEQLGKDSSFRNTSRQTYGKPGIALCWFHWAVFETLDTDGDLDRTFALFRDVEGEITRAAQENRLKVRRIIPLPDCRIPTVLSVIPHGLLHIASLITWQPPRYAWAWNHDEPKFDNAEFFRALHRQNVAPSPARERIGIVLCEIYAWVYAPLLVALVAAVAAFGIGLAYRWNSIPAFTNRFLAQQLFLVSFLVLALWYLLFDASGLFAVPRYLVFNNVMLPLLLVYYARHAWRLSAGRNNGRSLL
ncbi:MAG TPA: hypothetical protein VGC39_08805, partial [Candidatus Methylacidiphilales bacterium]